MKTSFIFVMLAMFGSFQVISQGIIVNHTCTKINQIPESAILVAKQKLHIAYGHTSHGSQLIDGMTGLVGFMNGKGATNNLYAWNNGGTGGALDLHDRAMAGDVGYYPDWVDNTRSYLGVPNPATGRGTGANADVNVVIWSWCGQVSSKYTAGTLNSQYITPMVQLESDYPGIKFVYMTGHLDHVVDAANKAANKTIRDFCVNNNKILYDFVDIESYDPDNKFYQFAGDDCSYYASATGIRLGNWATEWQNSHTLNVDWYSCSSAHSEPLNANQKAYAAWWLWAKLGGWSLATSSSDLNPTSAQITLYPNPANDKIYLQTNSEIVSVTIFSANGQVVKAQNINCANGIDVSDLARGIYFIDAQTMQGIQHSRFVKE